MSYTIEVKYFNSLVLRKTVEAEPTRNQTGSWPVLPWEPSFLDSTGTLRSYADFPWGTHGTDAEESLNWYIEEARIKGGFNNSIMELGVRAYSVNRSTTQNDRSNSLIFSGVFNDRTNFNKTNVFSVSESIIKDANPEYGSIQKLFAEDTNLLVFQENKVHKALINKSTIYSGEQGAEEAAGVTSVIGQLVPYLGEYGISRNPESFGTFGYRKYFTDKDRSAILRLSRDGITEISSYGMRDYFRDQLATLSDTPVRREVFKASVIAPSLITNITVPDVDKIEIGSQVDIDYGAAGIISTGCTVRGILSATQVAITPSFSSTGYTSIGFWFSSSRRDKAYGGYDNRDKNYTLSMQTAPRFWSTDADTFNTLSFDENVQGWTSFYSYKPIFIDSLKNNFYTFINDKIYKHYVDNVTFTNRCKFYGSATPDEANVKIVFNPSPSIKKNFNTISYEGQNGWEVESIVSGKQGFDNSLEYQDTSSPIKSYDEGAYTENGVTLRAGFDRKENQYVANIVNSSAPRPGEIIFGTSMSGVKGYFTTVNFKIDATTNVGGVKELFLAGSEYVMSSH